MQEIIDSLEEKVRRLNCELIHVRNDLYDTREQLREQIICSCYLLRGEMAHYPKTEDGNFVVSAEVLICYGFEVDVKGIYPKIISEFIPYKGDNLEYEYINFNFKINEYIARATWPFGLYDFLKFQENRMLGIHCQILQYRWLSVSHDEIIINENFNHSGQYQISFADDNTIFLQDDFSKIIVVPFKWTNETVEVLRQKMQGKIIQSEFLDNLTNYKIITKLVCEINKTL